MIEAWRDEPRRRWPCLPQRERICEEGNGEVRVLNGERREEDHKGRWEFRF